MKKYPKERLTGSYVGHQVRFFNIPKAKEPEAKSLCIYLTNLGFYTNVSATKNSASVLINLDRSENPKALEEEAFSVLLTT